MGVVFSGCCLGTRRLGAGYVADTVLTVCLWEVLRGILLCSSLWLLHVPPPACLLQFHPWHLCLGEIILLVRLPLCWASRSDYLLTLPTPHIKCPPARPARLTVSSLQFSPRDHLQVGSSGYRCSFALPPCRLNPSLCFGVTQSPFVRGQGDFQVALLKLFSGLETVVGKPKCSETPSQWPLGPP